MTPLPVLFGVFLLVGCASLGLSSEEPDRETAARLRVAEVAERSGQSDMALSLYGAAVAANPGAIEPIRRQSAALARTGRLAEAERTLNGAMARQPNSPVLLGEMARLRLRAGRSQEALALLDRALAAAPRDARLVGARAVALDLLGRPDEARAQHDLAASLAPLDAAIANNRAVSLLLAGQVRPAVEILSPFAGRDDLPERVQANLSIARRMEERPGTDLAGAMAGE